MSSLSKKEKKALIRIGAGALLLAAALLAPLRGPWRLALFLVAYLAVGGDVLLRAARNIAHGQIFDENFLMALATVGAFGTGQYPEGVAVMLFYQVGELFQSYAVGRSRKSISDLMDIRPDYANIIRDGELVQVDPEEVAIGDTILVKAGEKIPLDGRVIEGRAMADTSALTGESVPRQLSPGSEALSGCINLTGVLTIEVTKEFGESTVSKILDLVENASSKKAKAENFITKFARYYTPVVVISALVLAFLPPLVLQNGSWSQWVQRALIFLVISCPCALVISVPLGFFGGIGGASKCGVLVKGSNYLEALAKTETVVFDKTGTLTKGTFEVTQLEPTAAASKESLLETAALAEAFSSHPISLSLKQAYGKEVDSSRVTEVNEIPGRGVSAKVDGHAVALGNNRLMAETGIQAPEGVGVGTVVHVAQDGQYLGYILIADQVKEDAAAAVVRLKQQNRVRRTVMLTGDTQKVAEQVAQQLGLDAVYAQLLPGDKVAKVEQLLQQKSPQGVLAFVGDGINDAPVLSRADVGIAMGGLGSDAAIEAADIVIMDDKPSKISTAISIAKRTLTIVKQNIVFALVVKGVFLLLGAFGMANMWEAVFADVGVSVIAILNSMRALKVDHLQQNIAPPPVTAQKAQAL